MIADGKYEYEKRTQMPDGLRRAEPGEAPFTDFPDVVVGWGPMEGCLVLRLADGSQHMLCDFENPTGPGGATLHTAARLLEAGAASRSADVQPADCNAQAKQWLTQRMPAELSKLVAMPDASSDQSETLGEWAGELALSAYAAGYQAAVDVQPADDVPVSEWGIDSGWLTVGSDSVRVSAITSVRLCQYGEPDVFVGYLGFSVPIRVTFADVEAARRGHAEILQAIRASEVQP